MLDISIVITDFPAAAPHKNASTRFNHQRTPLRANLASRLVLLFAGQ
jgi:hypothetical protein